MVTGVDGKLMYGLSLFGRPCPICGNQKCRGGHPYAPITPRQAAPMVEEIVNILDLRRDATIADLKENWREEIDVTEPNFLMAYNRILREMLNAQVVMWRPEMWDSAITGSEIFSGTKIDPLIFVPRVQVWLPDRDFFYSEEGAKAMNVEVGSNVTATFVYLSGKELWICPIVGPPETDQFFSQLPKEQMEELVLKKMFFRLRMWRQQLDQPITEKGACDIVALAQFMRQPIVEIQTHNVDRAERRRLEKAGKPMPRGVKVVTLRHIKHAQSTKGEPVDWSHRWWVSGHWRNQWMPATKTHEPRFIHAYVKGPEDMPLAEPRKSIYVVKR